MPSHPLPERHGLGQGTLSSLSTKALSFQATRDRQRTAPLKALTETWSPLISTRANLTSFPAHIGQETALPSQEGQGAQGGLWLSPLFLF